MALDIHLVNFLIRARLVQRHLQVLQHGVFQVTDTVLMELDSQLLRHLGERDGVTDARNIDGVVSAALSFGLAILRCTAQARKSG